MEEEKVNWEEALAAVDGRRGLLRELVEIFFAECPGLMQHIQQAIERQDPAELKLYAHRLKGCLRYFGDNRAARLALQLEDMGREGTIEGAAERFADLDEAIQGLLPALRRLS